MRRRLARQSAVASASEEVARALTELTSQDEHIRGDALRALAALTHLPETDPAPVVTALADFIRVGSSTRRGCRSRYPGSAIPDRDAAAR